MSYFTKNLLPESWKWYHKILFFAVISTIFSLGFTVVVSFLLGV